jgi:hypothetical protein
MRGLAALPFLPVMPGTGPLQIVHLDDVVDAIVFFLQPGAPLRQVFEVVGPRRESFEDCVRLFRRWLRWPPARPIAVPDFVSRMLFRLGDAVALLGWRPPIRSTARLEVYRGATGDPGPLAALGIIPRNVEAVLMAEPASVQERWFAKLYFLKPLIFLVLVLFWLATGFISLGPGWEVGMALMREGGIGERMGAVTVVAGALADIAIGLAIAYRPISRYGLWAALAISPTYAVVGTILVPRLWADPLGPMLKIWPIMVLIAVALAIREDR